MRKPVTFLVLTLLLTTSLLLLGACSPAAPTSVNAVPTQPPTQPPADPTNPPVPTAALSEPVVTPTATQEQESTPVVLEDGSGNTISLKSPAQRVVSLAPSNTEILFAIGAGGQVIGRDQFSDYPSEAQEISNIGGGFDQINTETVITLNPDLVLAADITPPEQLKALQDLGLTVFQLPNPTNLDGMYENLRTVALLTGHSEEAESLIKTLKQRVSVVEEKVAKVKERPLVFYELDGTDPNAPWTSGAGTFIDTLLTMAGGDNLGNILDGSWAQMNLEVLIEKDPQIILLGDAQWGGVTPEAVAARAGWDVLSAVKEGRVYPFDDNLVSRPGPRMVDGLETLAKFLHPELFE